MKRLRVQLFRLLETEVSGSLPSRLIELFLIILIFLNIIAIILESVQSINLAYAKTFGILEDISIFIFTIEYILRVWTSVENPKYKKYSYKRIRYALSTMALIDLLSILPFYLNLLPFDLLFLRIIRLLRVFRLLKISRYLKALNIIEAVLRERREQILLSVMFILFLLVITSTIMFYVENQTQPDKFSSIPATMWWGIETLTTVGYGDMVPITTFGRILGGMIAILGIGLFALPAGILSSGLTEHLRDGNNKKDKLKRCPHCGGELHE